jgi:hypothetical protein
LASSKLFCQETFLGLELPRNLEYKRVMEELTKTAEVMDALGGNLAVAELTGSKPKAVWNWRGFKTFPTNTYIVMINALRQKGKTAPASLWGMKSPAETEATS